ncbi:MAG: hypothetical protein MP439_01815 [Ferrimicrobium sp.]|jgi:protein ImuB|nr:hypothetical protein [Ferrimicrobium sp.]
MMLVQPRRVVVVDLDGLALLAVEATQDDCVAVAHRGRVAAFTKAAQARGVVVGMRCVEAMARYPELELRERDGYREEQWLARLQRMFDDISPHARRSRHAVVIPSGPIARYFGTEERAVAAVDVVGTVLARTYPQLTPKIGVGDSLFIASLAATLGQRVPPGESIRFAGERRVEELLPESMATLLREVGLTLVADFQRLEPSTVAARFGGRGLHWHRLCRLEADIGVVDGDPADTTMCTTTVFDGDTIEHLSFRLMQPLDALVSTAEQRGLTLTKAHLTLVTTTGELTKTVEVLDGVRATELIARLRWFEQASRLHRDPLVEVRIEPMQWSPLRRRQLTFDRQERKESAVLATLTRLATLYGDDRVLVPVVQGGRSLYERGTWMPWSGQWPLPNQSKDDQAPWPGHLPGVSPSLVYRRPREVRLLDAVGTPVEVTADGVLTREPVMLVVGHDELIVSSSIGPWVVVERWWERRRRRYVRLMVMTSQGTKLVVREAQRWWLEGAFA